MTIRRYIEIVEGAGRESVAANVPTVGFPILYHVGSLDAAQKREGSFEGAGLSVSKHPDAWRRIARGQVAGHTWRCTKPGNRFINAHRLTKAARSRIAQWAVEQGLATRQSTYRVSWYDDEMESEMQADFTDRKQAETEAGMYDAGIEEVPGALVGTDALRMRTKTKANPSIAFDLILTVYAEEMGFDGVWWADKLDVAIHSAPRGVIVPSRVSEWQIERQEDQQPRPRGVGD